MDMYVPPGFRGDDYDEQEEYAKWAAAVRNTDEAEDLVNLPPHYRQGGIECIDAIKAALTEEEWRGFLKGQVIKYVWRERWKGGDESLAKARYYQERLREMAQPTKGRAISKAEAEEGEDMK